MLTRKIFERPNTQQRVVAGGHRRNPAHPGRAVLFLGLLAFLPGCGSLKGEFKTHRDPNYGGKLERLLIVYYNEDDAKRYLGSKFSDTFLARVSEALKRKNVPVHVARPMQGAMDEQAVV